MELHGLDSEAEVFFYEQDFYVLIIRGATWPQNPPEVASALK